MTRIVCPHCGRSGSTPKELAEGTKVRCPACTQTFTHATDPSQVEARTLRVIDVALAGPLPRPEMPPMSMPPLVAHREAYAVQVTPEVISVPSQVVVGTPAVPARATKDCPYCSEEILDTAKKCKHCGEIVDLALRAAEEAKVIASRPRQSPVALQPVINNTIVNTVGGVATTRRSVLSRLILVGILFMAVGLVLASNEATAPGGLFFTLGFICLVIGLILTVLRMSASLFR